MVGIRELLDRGGTVIFLEQNSPKKGLFGADKPVEVAKRPVLSARKLVGEKHILLRDLREGDLAGWAGSGEVASNVLGWPEYANYQAWLAGGQGKDRAPLVAQYWGENGRVILCQLEVGRRLAQEPVAQLVLRNLLSYAREVPLPAPRKAVRFAVPPEALEGGKFNTARFVLEPKKEDLKGAAAVLILLVHKGDESAMTPGFDLGQYLSDGGKLLVQSRFGPELMEALNQLTPLNLAGQTIPSSAEICGGIRGGHWGRPDEIREAAGLGHLGGRLPTGASRALKIPAASRPSRQSLNFWP
jgi:hypothetical protein